MTFHRILLPALLAVVLLSCAKPPQSAVHPYKGTGVPSDQISALTDTAYRIWRGDGTDLPLDTTKVILIFPHPEVMYMEAPIVVIGAAGDTVRLSQTMLIVHRNGSWRPAFTLAHHLPPPSDTACGVPPAPRPGRK